MYFFNLFFETNLFGFDWLGTFGYTFNAISHEVDA